MNNEIFNAKVSIITKSEIRYEGILNQINAQQQNLTLKDVRSFGTEGRRPGNEIPPVSQTFDLIVFRAHEINELKVIQPAEGAAIVETPQPKSGPSETMSKPEEQNPQYHSKQTTKGQNSRAFDFDEMLEKITDLEKMKNQPQQQQNQKYQKSGFFDNLSSTVSEKQLGPRTMTRDDRKNQNDQDTETFGQFYKHNNNNRRGGGGGGNPRTFNNEVNDHGYKTQNRNYNNNNTNRYRNNQDRVIYVEKKIDKQEVKPQN